MYSMAMPAAQYQALTTLLGDELRTLKLLVAPKSVGRQAYLMAFVMDSSGNGVMATAGNVTSPMRMLQVVAELRARADKLESAARAALA